MNRLSRTLRKVLSSDNNMLIVGLVDAVLYFVIAFGIVVGFNAVQNATTQNGHYTLIYSSVAFTLGIAAAACGLISAVCTHTVQQRLNFRSPGKTVLGTIAGFGMGACTTWLVVTAAAGSQANPLELAVLSTLAGMVSAPVGYRLYGFVNVNVATVTYNENPAAPVDLGQNDAAMTADGKTLIEYHPDSEEN